MYVVEASTALGIHSELGSKAEAPHLVEARTMGCTDTGTISGDNTMVKASQPSESSATWLMLTSPGSEALKDHIRLVDLLHAVRNAQIVFANAVRHSPTLLGQS